MRNKTWMVALLAGFFGIASSAMYSSQASQVGGLADAVSDGAMSAARTVAEGAASAVSAVKDLVQPPRHGPSEIRTTLVDPKIDNWEDPEVCGGCHERQYKGWQGSMHSIAFKDPIFQAEWAIAEKETGGQLQTLCGGCHTPIGTLTNTVKFDPKLGKHGGFTAPGVAEKGVSCDVCHSVSGSSAKTSPYGGPGNNSLIYSPGTTKFGPLKDAKSPYHETQYSELHTKADFCGNCHNIFHPVNKFPIEHTYDEWKQTPYAQNGIVCQDCHMVPVDTARRVADEMKRPKDLANHGLGGFAGAGAEQERSLVHDHGFVGGNSVVAPLLGVEGGEEHRAEAIKRLQSAAELDMFVRPLDASGTYELKVKVTNQRAGHHLPTSLTFVRQLWLDVTVTDANGKVILRSGQLDANNYLEAGSVVFRNNTVDAKGNDTLDPWKIAGITEFNTIPPKGFRYGAYAFRLPAYQPGFKVTAKLNYMSYDQKFANKLLGKDAIRVPVVNMKELTRSFDTQGREVAAIDRVAVKLAGK